MIAAAVTLVAAAPAGAEPLPRRRLESVQVSAVRNLLFEPSSAGDALALAVEAGRFLERGVGVTAVVRGQHYRAEGDFQAPLRSELFAGARVYLEPVPGRVLAALGAGLMLRRHEDPDRFPETDVAAQKYLELYVGVAALRSRCTDLEIGFHTGYSPDEEYVWAGLALGVRRRMW